MRRINRSLFIGVSGLVLMCAQTQSAYAVVQVPQAMDIHLSYQVSFNPGFTQTITEIATFNTYVNGSGRWWPAQVSPDENGVGVINDPFAKSTDNNPLSALLVGLVSDLPGDPAGQKHVVLMMDDTAASAGANIAWGTLFRNTSEEQLISDIELSMGTSRPEDQTDPSGALAWDTASANLDNFAYGDATNGILANGGLPLSAWFSLGEIPFAANAQTIVTSNFTVMAWSDGQTLGTGTSTMTFSPAPVPVPAAIWLFTSAIAGLGVVNFRRKS